MATVQEQPRTSSAGRHEVFVEEQLARARGRIRLLDVSAALLGLVIAMLSYGLVMVLWGWKLPPLYRQLALGLYGVAALIYLGVTLVWPLCRRVNPYYAARQVERALPGAKNSLVNWLDLRAHKLPPAIRAALGVRAARDLQQAPPEQVIRGRHVAWLAAATAALAVAAIITFSILRPGPFFSRFLAVFAPFSEPPNITRTQLRLLEPAGGDAVVPINQSVQFSVAVDGYNPRPSSPDAVRLLFRYTPEDPVYEERRLEPGANEREWTTRLPAFQVQNGFWYRVAGGDAITPEYRIQVRSAPLLTGFTVTYHYRPYLRWSDATTRDPNLEALRGTKVTLLARTNRTVAEGQLLIDGAKTPIRAELDPAQPDMLRFQLTLEQDGAYRIKFRSVEGEENANPMPYRIHVLQDAAPKVELTRPGEDVTLPANGVLQLEGAATDDIGLTGMTLRLQIKDGSVLQPKPFREGKSFKLVDGTYPRRLEYRDFVELDKVKDDQGQAVVLKPGTVVEYWLEATDNCDYPQPNVGRSEPTWKVIIAEPEKDPEKLKEQREQAREEKQKADAEQDRRHEQAQEEAKKRLDEQDPKAAQARQEKEEQELREKQQRIEEAIKEQQRQQQQEGDRGQAKQEPKDEPKGEKKDQPDDRGQAKQQPDQAQEEGKPAGQGKDAGKPDRLQEEKGQHKPEGKNNGQPERAQEEKGQHKPEGQPGQQPAQAKEEGKSDPRADRSRDQGEGKPQAGVEQKPGEGKVEGKAQPQEAKGNDKQGGTGDGKTQAGEAKGDQQSTARGQEKPQGKDVDAKGDPRGKTKEGSATAKNAGAGKGGDPNGEPNNQVDGQGVAKGADKDAGKQPVAGGNKRGVGQEKPTTPEDVARLSKQLQSSDQREREDAARKLQEISKQGTKLSKDAADALKKAGYDVSTEQADGGGKGQPDASAKQQPGDGAASASAPKEAGQQGPQDAGTPKNAGGSDKGSGGSGTGKPGDQNATAEEGNAPGEAKAGNQTAGGTPGGGARSGEAGGSGEEAPGAEPADPSHSRRAGELQLQRFKDQVTRDMLKKLNMTEQEFKDFLKAYEAANRRKDAASAKEPLPGPQTGGPLTNSGASRVTPVKPLTDPLPTTGPSVPPPEFRKAYKDFTEELSKLKRKNQ